MILSAGLASSILLIFIFLIDTGMTEFPPPTMIIYYITDGMLLWLPALLLWPRAKWTGPTVLLLVSFFFYCNVLHNRHFGVVMSLQTLSLAGTVDSLVVRAAVASMRWYDCIFLLPTVISALAIVLWSKKSSSPLPKYFKLTVTIAFFIITIAAHGKAYIAERNELSGESLKKFFSDHLELNHHIRRHGVTAGYLSILFNNYNYPEFKVMPPECIAEIKHWSTSDTISGVERNRDKNLILIIVESLNTRAIEWEHGGRKAMPNLNKILADSSTIAFTSVYPQTGLGSSSDGQMMYYSGIYPSHHRAMAEAAPYGPYPSLAKLYPDNAFEIIGEWSATWNHGITNKAFGFSRLHDKLGYWRIKSDKRVFADARDIISHSKKPFFASITTLEMHYPYNKGDHGNAWFSSLPFGDERDKQYLEACVSFDTALGEFISWLKTSGIWQQSVIVIASDHNAPEMTLSSNMNDRRILFAILNSGLPGFRCDEVVGQIDVFPTLVDVSGRWRSTRWHGFGHSLLRTVPGFAITYHGNVAGDTIGKSADVERQRRAVELSQKWIFASNKDRLIFDKRQDR